MKRLVLTSFVLLLSLTSVAFGQIGFDFVGGGARSQAMGNAYIAISDDASAVGWNPAGLIVHETPLLGINWGSMAPRGATKVAGQTWDASGTFNSIGQAAFVAPLRISGRRFVGSLGITGNVEEFLNSGYYFYDDSATVHAFVDQGTSVIDFEYTTPWYDEEVTDYHSNLNSFNAGFGTMFLGNTSIGFALNVYYGRGERYTRTDHMQIAYPSDKWPQAVLMEFYQEVVDTTKYSGYNFTFGLKHAGSAVDLGLLLRTPFNLKTTTGVSIHNTLTYNGSIQSGATNTIFIDNIVYKYEIPWYFGGGVAFHPNEKFIAALDLEYRGFSGKKVKERIDWEVNQDEEIYTEYDYLWFDAVAVRAGLEYVVHTDSKILPIVPLRAGFSFVQYPYSGSEAAAEVDTTGEGESIVFNRAMSSAPAAKTLSAGFGVQWSQIHLDVAYRYTFYDLDFDLLEGDAPLMIENRDHKLSLSFTGYF